MSNINIFKMMRFVEKFEPKYKAAEYFLQDEDIVPYRDIVPINYLNGYVTDDGVQGIWKDKHSYMSGDSLYEYHNNKLLREFKYYEGTEDVHHEINFDEAGKWSTEIVYYPNGQEKKVKPFVKGNIHGEVKEYYRNGDIMSITTYDKGSIISKEKYQRKFDY